MDTSRGRMCCTHPWEVQILWEFESLIRDRCRSSGVSTVMVVIRYYASLLCVQRIVVP